MSIYGIILKILKLNKNECKFENIKMVFACNQLFDFYRTVLFLGYG
jgi:hypothetical protein